MEGGKKRREKLASILCTGGEREEGGRERAHNILHTQREGREH